MNFQKTLSLILLITVSTFTVTTAKAEEINSERLSAIVKTLASDEFEGRAPGGPGEAKTIAYLTRQFQSLGLEPGGDNAGWTQAVPLLRTQIQAPGHLQFDVGGQQLKLQQAQDVNLKSARSQPKIEISEVPVVFVGFGVTAPERQWDDFGDIDVSGKVVIFLVNDPDFAAGPEEAVAGRFGNSRMTYYGRWMYKYEEAERRGALAALVIHEDKAAGYGWTVAASGPGESYSIVRPQEAGEPLKRNVVFAVWTAEESGLLGSAAYVANPVYPLEKTVANFTLDILQTAGPARDVILVGEGQSDLDVELERAAALQGRVLTPENLPENGLFFRADHFSLARGGVPVLLIMGIAGGSDLVEGGRAAGDAWIAEYTGNCYYQTCDAWSPDWDLRGAIMDIELFHTIIKDLGNSDRWPQWNDSSEFKAVRSTTDAVRGS